MFTLVNALLLKPLAGQADELVGLYSHDRTKPESSYRGFAYANYVDIRDGNDVFESLMAHTFSMVGVPAGDTTRQTFIEVVSSNYFDALGVPLAAGRAFTLDEERPTARDPGRHRPARAARPARHRPIKINAIDFTVVGVAPRGVHRDDGAHLAGDVAAARHVRRRRQRHLQEQRLRAWRIGRNLSLVVAGPAEARRDDRRRRRRGSTRCRGSSSARIRPRTRTSC